MREVRRLIGVVSFTDCLYYVQWAKYDFREGETLPYFKNMFFLRPLGSNDFYRPIVFAFHLFGDH